MNLVNYDRAATYFGVSKIMICKVINDNAVMKVKVGREVLVDIDELIHLNAMDKIEPLVNVIANIIAQKEEK